MNVGHHTTISNGDVTKKLTQLLIVSHRQLDVSWYNSSLLVISSCVSRQFKHLQIINFKIKRKTENPNLKKP
ncbi:hypothetical protein Hanom_Chr08g00738541 [Helianthus anomalus]